MSIAWLFPGQGSQSVGMAKDVLASSAGARFVFARVDAALGEPLSEVILEGPEERLTLTVNTQPAILATSLALLAALRERLPRLPAPAFAAGHSLGEYTALVAAGALSLEDAVRLVRIRGRAMQDAVPAGVGAMSAIMAIESARLAPLVDEAARGEVLSAANFNAPGQIVVAGHAGAIARLGELVARERGRAVPLKVSAPFHCALMAPAARILARELAGIEISPPAFAVIANVDAVPNTEASRVADLLVRQVDGPVQWQATIERMVADGVTHALEIGPGKVLAGLVKRITKGLKILSVNDRHALDRAPEFVAEAQGG